jgi:anti-sigma B factor antagonist
MSDVRDVGPYGADADAFRAETANVDGRAIVTVRGELDLVTARDLEAALDRVTAGARNTIVVDLSHVSFADSTGLSVLVKGQQAAHREGLVFVVRSPQRRVRRVLELSGLDAVLHIV